MAHQKNVFPHLANKRMGELTEQEQANAREDWIRANWSYFAGDPSHVSFLLQRIDQLRGDNNVR